MRVFISHSHEDKQIVSRITDDLRKHGIQVWLDEDLISPGEQWADKISEAFENSNAILVIISHNTAESRWQTSEIAFAVATQRRDPSKRIIPVLIDRQADVPFFLKDLVYCDLSSESQYEHSFELLLRALTKQPKMMMDIKEADHRKIAVIRAEKELLRHDVEILDRRKAVWTSTVLGASASIIAALVTLFFGGIATIPWIVSVFKEYGSWLAGVLIGATSSLIALLVARRFQNRSARKERGNGK